MTTVNDGRSYDYHIARLLVLLRYFAPYGKKPLSGLTKLAKLDFLLRYPSFTDRLFLSRGVGWPLGAEPSDSEQIAVESRMIRYKYGPWDLRVPRRMSRPTADTVKISFFDVYRYLYLDQNSIDNNVIGHNDSHLNVKRISVFQLVYGLTSDRIIELATRRGRLNDEAQQARDAARSIRDVLAANDEPDPIQLGLEKEKAERDLAAAEQRVQALRVQQVGSSPEGSLSHEIMIGRARLTELEDSASGLRRDAAGNNWAAPGGSSESRTGYE